MPNESMWLCTTAARAAKHRRASSAISAGSFGVFGFCVLLVTPLIAASMITGSATAHPLAAELQLVAVC